MSHSPAAYLKYLYKKLSNHKETGRLNTKVTLKTLHMTGFKADGES